MFRTPQMLSLTHGCARPKHGCQSCRSIACSHSVIEASNHQKGQTLVDQSTRCLPLIDSPSVPVITFCGSRNLQWFEAFESSRKSAVCCPQLISMHHCLSRLCGLVNQGTEHEEKLSEEKLSCNQRVVVGSKEFKSTTYCNASKKTLDCPYCYASVLLFVEPGASASFSEH